LIGADELTVSCYHHQEINDLGKGLTAVATSVPGGTIEAVEASDGRWAVGVQWHPEDSSTQDPLQRALLAAFIDACRKPPPPDPLPTP
jgi:putative glutamine amidotransferase